jgi:lipoate-protein ligase A
VDVSLYVLNSGPGNAPENMALDEALLLNMPRLQAPVLRFYGWSEQAASFGYFQRYTEVERMTLLRPLVRRPTGGGIVPHDCDWTYSLIFPASHPWYRLRATGSYRESHQWIRSAFAKLRVECELAAEASHAGPGQCFVGYEISDVLWKGRKVAGAAQRRTRSGLLIQGSVQPPQLSIARATWETGMLDTNPFSSEIPVTTLVPDDVLLAAADRLAQEKYSRSEFNQQR